MRFDEIAVDALEAHVKNVLTKEEITRLIETPKHAEHGDIAFPCFQLAKTYRKSPQQIAKELSEVCEHPFIEKFEANGPYLNAFLKRKLISKQLIEKVTQLSDHYGSAIDGIGARVVIDFSSPNIAKPFSMGHLRSTVIGNSLALLAEKNGCEPVKINHLGDWGTQFGKLIAAYKHWGNEAEVKENPIPTLLKLYVKFHKESEENPQLSIEGRGWFKKLEGGDLEAESLWKWFKDESLKEFEKVYQMLGISFDKVQGESFYNDKMEEVVKELSEKGLLHESEGARVVNLGEDQPPCLIEKTDGTTLYATRDLAAAIYRYKTYDFQQCLYVVGGEQQLHFEQIFQVLGMMGYDWNKKMTHVPFGLILKDGKKMSTRKGKVVLLEEVLQNAIDKAKDNMMEKNPELKNLEDVAKQVGVGAVIFHDLKNERLGSVEFDLEQMLKFEGDTGPYVQYTNARCQTILTKAERKGHMDKVSGLEDPYSWEVVKLLERFPTEVKRAFDLYEPSVIAKYLLKLSQAVNTYYGNVKILQGDAGEKDNKLALLKSVTIVLQEGLRLLGIKAPKKM
ncbi:MULTISPECIES: arginine--tRNA ligase [Bacillaceae]|uniref:Arginine--tRNA ligase n=1 Tax=Evansella alkalicola TaxID=745819 RepID=A0ABS6JYU1_9BACI|nr:MULTISPECIES: arginine--tRNA ligase [Bacillaceae]MBU9723770.1 arginine--tRNA ligase [Bacillus alkalicola]